MCFDWLTVTSTCLPIVHTSDTSLPTRKTSFCRQLFANMFADCFCAVHTHQLDFANTGLPTLVCRVKATLQLQPYCDFLSLLLLEILHCRVQLSCLLNVFQFIKLNLTNRILYFCMLCFKLERTSVNKRRLI